MTDLLPVLDLTPVGLLGLVVVMVLLGYLIPLRTHRLHLSDKDATIAAQRETIEAAPLHRISPRISVGSRRAVTGPCMT